MQQSETRFDNIPMLALKIPIMFKSVGRYSVMTGPNHVDIVRLGPKGPSRL